MSESQLSSLILCALTLSLSLSPHARQSRPAHTKPGSSPLPPRPPPSSAAPSMRGNKKSTRSKHQFCEMSECDQGAYLIRGACSHRHRLVLLVAHPNKHISLFMVRELWAGCQRGGVPGNGLERFIEGLRSPFQLCRLLLWRSTTGLTEHPLTAAWLRVERSAVKSVNSLVSLEVKTRRHDAWFGSNLVN